MNRHRRSAPSSLARCRVRRGLVLLILGWLAGDLGRAADVVAHFEHQPRAPKSGEAVTLRARVPGFVTNLVCEVQAVDPGAYIELQDPAFRKVWTEAPMVRDPVPPGADAGGNSFSLDLPGAVQTPRRLVRYRFRGNDAQGHEMRYPVPGEVRTNFAYFVYDGVPGWSGALEPRSTDARRREPAVFSPAVMRRVQSYHLLARQDTVEKVTWRERTSDSEYRYTGTLVADGVVYDHVRLRARGGVWRYAMGKNMWKIDLPPGQPLQARDDYGRPEAVPWGKVNLRACIQQGDYGMRGEQGMFESVGFRLFELAGVAAPRTHWIQLRIVSTADEAPPDQYTGDYWGLYLAIESIDDRFLKAHGLPDGNLFRIENGEGQLSHHAPPAPNDGADVAAFIGAYERREQPESWWRAQLDLPGYYSYRAICECIHHYDIGDGKNYYYYANPRNRRWQVVPWDIDLTWAEHMYGSGQEPFAFRVLHKVPFLIEYQNRLREIRDLLFQSEETDRLIDECAAVIADPGKGPSPVDADRLKWDFHPALARGEKARQGLFYRASATRDFAGMVKLMKSYVRSRGDWVDRALLQDSQGIPATPTASYAGEPGFPAAGLRFAASAYRGWAPYVAAQWRLAEIAPTVVTGGRPVAPGKYEITAAWESGEKAELATACAIPAGVAEAGKRYRVRVRFKDRTGYFSHWSAPVEFVAGRAAL